MEAEKEKININMKKGWKLETTWSRWMGVGPGGVGELTVWTPPLGEN